MTWIVPILKYVLTLTLGKNGFFYVLTYLIFDYLRISICGPKLTCSPEKQCRTKSMYGPKDTCCKDDENCELARPYYHCKKDPYLNCPLERQCSNEMSGSLIKKCCKEGETCHQRRGYKFCRRGPQPTTLPTPRKCQMYEPDTCTYPERCVAKACKIDEDGKWLCDG